MATTVRPANGTAALTSRSAAADDSGSLAAKRLTQTTGRGGSPDGAAPDAETGPDRGRPRQSPARPSASPTPKAPRTARARRRLGSNSPKTAVRSVPRRPPGDRAELRARPGGRRLERRIDFLLGDEDVGPLGKGRAEGPGDGGLLPPHLVQVVEAHVGHGERPRPQDAPGFHGQALGPDAHHLGDEDLGPGLRGQRDETDLLAHGSRSGPGDLPLRAVREDEDRLRAGRLGQDPGAGGPQPGRDEAGDAGFSPRPRDRDAARDAPEGPFEPDALEEEIEKEEAEAGGEDEKLAQDRSLRTAGRLFLVGQAGQPLLVGPLRRRCRRSPSCCRSRARRGSGCPSSG